MNGRADGDSGLSIEDFRREGHALVDRLAEWMQELREGKHSVNPPSTQGAIIKSMPTHAPEHGEPFSNIMKLFEVVKDNHQHWQHPQFFAYFPSVSTPESILADMIVNTMSNPGFHWAVSPASTELEVVAMDWLARMFGLSDAFLHSSGIGGGVLQTSASDAALVATIAARSRAQKLLPILRPNASTADFVILGTTQTHSLGAKAGLILGLPYIPIPTQAKDDWALTGEELEKTLTRLESEGKVPFCLIATLGSTSSGAIDRLSELTAVAERHPLLFIHVDAAWAGVFLALPELRATCGLDAINKPGLPIKADGEILGTAGEVHSFCTNLHKQGLVQFDASAFWMRERRILTEALDLTPPFLRHAHTGKDVVPELRNWCVR